MFNPCVIIPVYKHGQPLARIVEAARCPGGQHAVGDLGLESLAWLYWLGVPVISVPTRSGYPLDGVSRFRLWQDKALMVRLQARLFFGLLRRSPGLPREAVR